MSINEKNVTEIVTCSIPSAQRILKACITAGDPAFLHGPPGIGKSDLVYSVADEIYGPLYADTHELQMRTMGRPICIDKATGTPVKRPWVRDIRALLHEPVDFVGVPHVEGGITRFCPTDLLPTIEVADPRGGVVFFDELTQAEPQVANALLGWILDGEISGRLRQPGWVDIAAGNRQKDGTFSKKLSKAMGSRFATHLELSVSMDAFSEWGLNNGIKAQTLAFIRLRPELLHDFNPQAEGNSFPCPRTWAKADGYVDALAHEDELPFFSGLLGKGAAVEFITFLRDYEDMISPDQCILQPDTSPLPKKPSQMYAMAGAMARRVTKDNAERIFRYMSRMTLEFQVVWIKDATRISPEISMTKEFSAWFIKHGKLLS